ncbi:MAG: hypothetical protein ACJ77E_00840 [Gaiellaceae bacterium]
MGSTEGRAEGVERRGAQSRAVARARAADPFLVLVAAALAIAAVSLVVLPGSPAYDPWAWIVWGREFAHLDLSTPHGPSFKPLPVAVTTVLSIFGGAAPALWLVVVRAAGIVAVATAFRVAARLAPGAKVFAGLVAAGGVLLIDGFLESVGRGWSEFLVAAAMLVAVERHLDGARRAAFVLIFAASLVRPETWPFLGLYALYLWRRDPGARALVAVLLVLVPVLWYGPELVSSGNLFRSQERARQPLPGRPALAKHPALAVLRQGRPLVLAPLEVLAAFATVFACVSFVRRREHAATAILGLGCAIWIATVAVMSQFGYTGNPRYLIPAAVFVCVLAGIGTAMLVRFVCLGRRHRAARTASAIAMVAILAALAPFAASAVHRMRSDADGIRRQHAVFIDLGRAVSRAGGRARVIACGHVSTGPFEVPMVAWTLGVHIGDVGITPPSIIFRARQDAPPPADAGRRRFETARWEVYAACR